MALSAIHVIHNFHTRFNAFQMFLYMDARFVLDFLRSKRLEIRGQIADLFIGQEKCRHAHFHPGSDRGRVFQERKQPRSLDTLTHVVRAVLQGRRILCGAFQVFLDAPTLSLNMVAAFAVVFGNEAAATLLLFKIEREYWGILKTFLQFLKITDENELPNVKVNKTLLSSLENI